MSVNLKGRDWFRSDRKPTCAYDMTPATQQAKRSEGGMWNLRYKVAWKQQWLPRFQQILADKLLYCGVRYAF